VAERRVCVGVIAGAHGVRGAVRVKSFTDDPAALRDFAGISDESGSALALQVTEVRPRLVVARIDGVDDRDAAAALRGTKLYLDRAALPEPEAEEFYHADLIGLACETPDGKSLGKVKAIHDFGAGDVIEIDGFDAMIPFTQAVVPEVDIAGHRLVVIPPEATE